MTFYINNSPKKRVRMAVYGIGKENREKIGGNNIP
jgi:hypothetical protein